MAGGPEQCSICLEDLDGGVTALACGHRFHAACLAQMAGAVGTAARTSRRGTLTACPNCRTVSRVAPMAPVVQAFSAGDRVLALYGQQWYPGVVRGVINSGSAYAITWDDGDEADVFAASVRAEAPDHAWADWRGCVCGGGYHGEMVACDGGCDNWFHFECLGLASAPEGEYICESCSGGGARMTSSRFWGVTWDRRSKKWTAQYTDADGKTRKISNFDDDEEAARAVNKAIRDAGLEGKRRMNAVDATGALVPRERKYGGDRSAVVAPDAARDPTATTSKFWGVTWNKHRGRWQAYYYDANGKRQSIGFFNNQESAARARDQAIRDAGLAGKRRMNAAVDGQLVPREYKGEGHGARYLRGRKRGRREEPAAAAPSTRQRK